MQNLSELWQSADGAMAQAEYKQAIAVWENIKTLSSQLLSKI